jgi:ribosomal protein L29
MILHGDDGFSALVVDRDQNLRLAASRLDSSNGHLAELDAERFDLRRLLAMVRLEDTHGLKSVRILTQRSSREKHLQVPLKA